MNMETQLKEGGIYGFFPTVWGGAFIDFGVIGALIYILLWGFAGGWGYAGARRSPQVVPMLLLVFILASIFLSPIQGPFGVANSVLVLFSLIVTGTTIDVICMRDHYRHASGELRLGREPG